MSERAMDVCECCMSTAENGGRHGTACHGLYEHDETQHPNGVETIGVPVGYVLTRESEVPFHAVGTYTCESCGADMSDGAPIFTYKRI